MSNSVSVQQLIKNYKVYKKQSGYEMETKLQRESIRLRDDPDRDLTVLKTVIMWYSG